MGLIQRLAPQEGEVDALAVRFPHDLRRRHLQAQLLPQLPHKAVRGRFAAFFLTAGKFPQMGVFASRPPLEDPDFLSLKAQSGRYSHSQRSRSRAISWAYPAKSFGVSR